MAHRNAQLLTLQSHCKRDPESYRSEFELQWSHFLALKDLFALKPSQKSPEFGDMVHFLSHVSMCYTEIAPQFSECMVELLDKHAAILHPQLRMQLLQALMHMRHRNVLTAEPVLELCFRLFSCQDKLLKATLHSYIVQDIKLANSRSRNERLNKCMQNYLYRIIEVDGEAAVKRALAVCTELWRRQVWRDARTVNVIASATCHESTSVMLAALKFFLGQDIAVEEEEDEPDADDSAPAGPTKDDVYRAYHKGTPTTKKKKIRKLKRVMRVVDKSKRRGQASTSESFAAMQLLHDPQSFAERLLARCQRPGVRFEARLALLQVVSRAIGSHELFLDAFYPYVQRFLKPSQREVVALLAAAVQACHRLVPPDTLRPVLSQVVDQFVHDKARPEVMTVGLKTVRELCVRCPRVMEEDLLSDLVLYKKEKDKHVKNAAKALVTLFRELKPSMLVKKERGRAADLGKELGEYGAADVKLRVDGVELLEDAIRRGKTGSNDDDTSDEEMDSDAEGDADADGEAGGLEAIQEQSSGDEDDLTAGAECDAAAGSGSDEDNSQIEVSLPGEDGEADGAEEGSDSEVGGSASGSGDEDQGLSGEDDAGVAEDRSAVRKGKHGRRRGDAQLDESGVPKPKLQACSGSLKQLKQQLAQAKASKAQGGSCGAGQPDGPEGQEQECPLEQMRILTQEDFERIRKLKLKKMVNEALAQQGLKSASRRAKVEEDLYEEMEEALHAQEARDRASDRRLDPDSLLGKRSGRADKAERMASVMAGREDRDEFGSAVSRKKQKSGGKSNVEKQKRKVLPLGAMKQQAANRKLRQKQKNNPKHHRGRASRGAWD